MPESTTPESTQPTLLISPLKAALLHGMAQTLTVLVRVQAPHAPADIAAARPTANVALVIDRSGSMDGPPLQEALRCAARMIDRLGPADLAALVVFDHRVEVLVPTTPARDRSVFHRALASVRAGGTTDLHGGWQAGIESLQPHAAGNVLSRVLLLSDGNANEGTVTEPAIIAAQAAAAARQGISTSTYGLGHGFNEDLMVAMARQGGGNNYYGETASDLFEPFTEEFDLISMLCARRLQLTLAVPEGVRLQVLNDLPSEVRDGFLAVSMPDLAYGSEAWLLVELQVPAALAAGAPLNLLQVAASAVTPAGVPIGFHDVALQLPALNAAAFEVLLPDALVAARKAELDASTLLQQAREAAAHGRWTVIDRLIADAQERHAGQPWLADILAHMAQLAQARDHQQFSKAALYSSERLRSRLAARDEQPDALVEEAAQASFLRRKRAQGRAQFEPRPDNDPQ